MDWKRAKADDIDLLARMNADLIRDENHRNRMGAAELAERMRGWLESEYTAAIFEIDAETVGYALYRESADEIYLRQFFIVSHRRRQGFGRQGLSILRRSVWAPAKRITVDVLAGNRSGLDFWRAVGFSDYAITLEMRAD